MAVAAYSEGAVLGVHQTDGGVHDGAQRDVQFEIRRDGKHGLQQAVEPVATFHDLRDAVLHFGQEFPKAKLRQRIPQWTGPDVVGHCIIIATLRGECAMFACD